METVRRVSKKSEMERRHAKCGFKKKEWNEVDCDERWTLWM